ncbi:MAG: hypothetical protein PW843_24680 [Azospirillaceae bacterium]|nr:hypothetical protein [Azospirillaceae bacterium]
MDAVTAKSDHVPEFGPGEHLLVWALRRMVQGKDYGPLVGREFADTCGEDGREVLATLHTFLLALIHTCRRELAIGHPGCPSLTADERQVLMLVAAAQNGKEAQFDAQLRWLALENDRPTLAMTARALAGALRVNSLTLVPPAAQLPTTCEREALSA